MKVLEFLNEATEYDKKEKLEERKPKSWLKSVSAFANGVGGILIFGVSDDEKLIGLDDAKGVSEKISEIVKTKMDPIPQVAIEFHKEQGKEILLLRVPAGLETPYYYVGEGNRTAFVRIGNQSVSASAMDLKRLVLRGSNITYDSLVSRYKMENYAFTKLRSVYRKRTGQEIGESDFLSFGLVDENGMLTNAGALLADDSPIRHSRLFCTRWYGLDKASGVMEAIDDKEFSGSLVTLLQNGEEFVTNNSKKRWKKTSTARIEMPDYPERAVLECIVNALIHRDYLDLGSEVHIDMYDDRLEIYSPGGMYDGSQVQDLDTDRVPSRRRNPIIADIFNRMNYMERRGSGFKKIKGDYRKEVNYREDLEPKFYSDHSSFWVTLYNLNYNIPVEEINLDNRKVNFNDEKVNDTIEKVNYVNERASYNTGKVNFVSDEIDSRGIDTHLAGMKVNLPTKEKIKRIYLKWGNNSVFGREDMSEILNISPTSASILIRKMNEAGLLETAVGCGRGKYKFK